LEVLELDIQPALTQKLASGRIEWAREAPVLDGVVICYDVSDEATFQHVRTLLGTHKKRLLGRC
jgi:hypothetical protein